MARFLKDKSLSKGKPPGFPVFIGTRKIENVEISAICYNTEEIKEHQLSKISEITQYFSDKYTTWINIIGLHNTDIFRELGDVCDIHPLVLEDILNTDERPKFSEDQDHLYFILKSLSYHKRENKVYTEQISIVLGKKYIITIQEGEYPYFEDNKKRLYSGLGKIRSYSPDYLCYTLIDTLVDNYILNIEKLGNAIENQEKNLQSNDPKIIEDIYHFKTELSYARKSIRPVKEVITRFMGSDSDLLNPRTSSYLKDLESLITQALESIEIYYTIVSEQQNTYSSNLSNSTNEIMKVLTIFSAIFIPLTFIAGIYGMNFNYMPELTYRYAYFIVLAIMVIISCILLIFFKKKKWL
ncbi:MAG: magnesium/cobalt transporter CorA [Culturomica sp.]|jgi:magnesium transporter|nr:magnesium/cobalt transporter CorA [Culturomica sp.]